MTIKTAGMVFTTNWTTCPKRHPMTVKSKRFARIAISDETGEKYKLAGDKIKCFGCQSRIIVNGQYFRCRDRSCNYDVCPRCALVSGIDDLSEGEEDESDFEFENKVVVDTKEESEEKKEDPVLVSETVDTEKPVVIEEETPGNGPEEKVKSTPL